jgi:hypothetical protein
MGKTSFFIFEIAFKKFQKVFVVENIVIQFIFFFAKYVALKKSFHKISNGIHMFNIQPRWLFHYIKLNTKSIS